MAFLRAYGEAANTLHEEGIHPLTRVDCFDWTDVCAKYDVKSYPTIRVYRKGRDPWEYKAALDAQSVIDTVKL